ncbi:hypothetical protein H9Q10_02675 [Eikenella sp. S3360]|uniref:Secreted protein n=1 Tax=Eikenella glucosivorans TaxID=2766967 RepID=A0ABS0N8E2_9NEIS|nr:hypothetical protein [Eikenella glucosivorans]MBH5328575.1 hypothetical protein [Eikenella glucosivorans]
MKPLALLTLLLAAPLTRADISFVRHMSHAECQKALTDSLEMYVDARHCEKADTEQTRQRALIGWYAVGELNSQSGNEEFKRCSPTPAQRQELANLVNRYEAIMRSPERLQSFCTPTHRARIAPLYPRYMQLLQELENTRRQNSNPPN